MRINGNVRLSEGAHVENLTLPSGNVFPQNANNAEVFVLNVDLPTFTAGQYRHNGLSWIRQVDYMEMGAVPNRVRADTVMLVPKDYQTTVQDTVTVEGTLNIEGELYIL